jgi:glutaryl-CoA dehydrogenase
MNPTAAGCEFVDFYQSESLLTDGERAVQDRVRAWAIERLQPMAAESWEREEPQLNLLPELSGLGITGGTVRGYECPGLSAVAYGLALQELARVDSSFTTVFGIHSSLAMGTIAAFGTEEQKIRWLPAMAHLDTLGAFALTEPDAGSDASHLTTTAAETAGGYLLNGTKRWIGNGMSFGLAVVWVRIAEGITGFLVEPDRPGLERTRMTGKLSKRAVDNAELVFADCFVPADCRLPVTGFSNVAEILFKTRHHVAWAALGEAIACYEAALTYAREREQFGRPIASFQLVQSKLVRMATEITKAQLLSIQLGRLLDAGKATPGMTAMAKANNSEITREATRLAREILGGNGILHEHGVMRHLVDIESSYTFEGTHDINTLIAGREITGLSAFT